MPWLAAVVALMLSGAMAVAVLARRADNRYNPGASTRAQAEDRL